MIINKRFLNHFMAKIIINCDGGSRGNPGRAAIGLIIRKDDEIIEQHGEVIGIETNNVAEYNSLIKSLELATKHTTEEVHVVMDSELVIRQMIGEYKVKNAALILLHKKAKELERCFKKVYYKSVSRYDEYQQKADALVNQALDYS